LIVTGGLNKVILGSTMPFGTLCFNQQLSLGIQVGIDPEMAPRNQLASALSGLTIGLKPLWKLVSSINCFKTLRDHQLPADQCGR
jgi:hypothetical protein